jgi:hypothetical protein
MKRSIRPELIELAKELRLLYPQGMKPGTKIPWRCSSIEAAKRLQDVEDIYEITLEPELVKNTVNQYIQSFGDNTQYMRILKYLIIKNGSSDLKTYMELLEDGQSIENQNNDWISNLK